jgi:hypothetical protein
VVEGGHASYLAASPADTSVARRHGQAVYCFGRPAVFAIQNFNQNNIIKLTLDKPRKKVYFINKSCSETSVSEQLPLENSKMGSILQDLFDN